MKRPLVPISLLLALLTPLAGKAQPQAQKLWGNVYVGINAAQLSKMYPHLQKFNAIDGGVILVGPQYRISDGNFTVQFHLKDDALDSVILSAGSPTLINELPQATQTYREIKADLTTQYGAPLFSEDSSVFSSNFIQGQRHVALTYMTIIGKPSITITYG